MFYPLIVILFMAGVVKFSNPCFNPQFVEEIKRQISGLAFHGSFIIEYRNGRISNVSFSSNSESDVISQGRAWFVSNPEIVCVRIPRFNVVLY